MRVLLLSVNHRAADVAMREQLALADDAPAQTLADLRRDYPQSEAVVLSTCNRTEYYLARPSHDAPSHRDLCAWISRRSDVDLAALEACTIEHHNEQAVRHLFRVACGLDSMVLGESQILGQVRRAYESADRAGAVGPVLHHVFQDALAVGKKVRRETDIDRGRMSVGSVAADFARQIFERFDDKAVLSIGAGEITKVMLQHLKSLSPRTIWLTNRTHARAVELAKALGLTAQGSPTAGEARSIDQLDDLLAAADIVVTGTGSRRPILTPDLFKRVMKARRHRPVFILDIAIPRDVDPAVGQLRNVYLYNLDDLQRTIAKTHDQKSEIAHACEAMVEAAAAQCIHRMQHQDVGKLVRLLRKRLHDLGADETPRTMRKLKAATDDQAVEAVMEEHTRRLVNKILHLPLSELHGNRTGAMGFYAAALRRLFALDSEESPAPDEADPAGDGAPDAAQAEQQGGSSPDAARRDHEADMLPSNRSR